MTQENRSFLIPNEGDSKMTRAEIQAANSGKGIKRALRDVTIAASTLLMAENVAAQSPQHAKKIELVKKSAADSLIEKISPDLRNKVEYLKERLQKSDPELAHENGIIFIAIQMLAETEDGKAAIQKRRETDPDFPNMETVTALLDKIYSAFNNLEIVVKNINVNEQYSKGERKTIYGPRMEENLTAAKALELHYQMVAALHDEFKNLEKRIDMEKTFGHIKSLGK